MSLSRNYSLSLVYILFHIFYYQRLVVGIGLFVVLFFLFHSAVMEIKWSTSRMKWKKEKHTTHPRLAAPTSWVCSVSFLLKEKESRVRFSLVFLFISIKLNMNKDQPMKRTPLVTRLVNGSCGSFLSSPFITMKWRMNVSVNERGMKERETQNHSSPLAVGCSWVLCSLCFSSFYLVEL